MPVNITVGFVQQLMEQNAVPIKQSEELAATAMGLNQAIKELKGQLNKNSKNSPKPPSSDGLKKSPVKKGRNLREKSGKKQGAQNGHGGSYIGTAYKHGINAFTAIRETLNGNLDIIFG